MKKIIMYSLILINFSLLGIEEIKLTNTSKNRIKSYSKYGIECSKKIPNLPPNNSILCAYQELSTQENIDMDTQKLMADAFKEINQKYDYQKMLTDAIQSKNNDILWNNWRRLAALQSVEFLEQKSTIQFPREKDETLQSFFEPNLNNISNEDKIAVKAGLILLVLIQQIQNNYRKNQDFPCNHASNEPKK
ncbi:MAG: hypothetical protein WDZ41_00450 [Candidatus Babeliales bacterium]